jgi:hypothetical protein
MISPPRPSNCVAEHVGTKHAGALPTEDEDEGMETKHTPGPWTVNGYRIEGPIDSRSKHKNGRMLIGGVVDELQDWRGTPCETIEERSAFRGETHANARLIASAPELYEALKVTLASLRDLRDELPLRDTRESHALILALGERARAALNLANGVPSSREGGDPS